MPSVAVVFLANIFKDFFLREFGDALLRPRFDQNSGVIHRDLDLHVAEIRAMIPLDDVQLVGMRMSLDIQPHARIEADAIRAR